MKPGIRGCSGRLRGRSPGLWSCSSALVHFKLRVGCGQERCSSIRQAARRSSNFGTTRSYSKPKDVCRRRLRLLPDALMGPTKGSNAVKVAMSWCPLPPCFSGSDQRLLRIALRGKRRRRACFAPSPGPCPSVGPGSGNRPVAMIESRSHAVPPSAGAKGSEAGLETGVRSRPDRELSQAAGLSTSLSVCTRAAIGDRAVVRYPSGTVCEPGLSGQNTSSPLQP